MLDNLCVCGHYDENHYDDGCEEMVKDGMKKYHMCRCRGFNDGK